MMIGVSLPIKWLATGEGLLGSREMLLLELYHKGVRSIELRQCKPTVDAAQVRAIADMLWNYGFRVTIHCRARSVDTAIADVFNPIEEVLRHLRQDCLTIIIHPVAGDNVLLLQKLSDYVTAMDYPILIAMENNRLLPGGIEGDSTALVLDAVERAERTNVGICFDMGHYGYYVKKNHPDTTDMLPPPAFFKRVVHTHIHALNGMKTHFPLDGFELNLKSLLNALARGYYGVYNIELDFPRFAEIREPVSGLLDSVKVLQEAMPLHGRLYDDVRMNYDREFVNALSVFSGEAKGTKMAFTQSSSYLFNTGGFLWGMDISFRAMKKLSGVTRNIEQFLSPLKLMIITHGHSDHFEKSTVKILAKNQDLFWVIPEFLAEQAMELGVSRERILVAKAGETITFGPLVIRPIPGRHLRPVTKKGVPALGYHITMQDGMTMAFPGDVRDYSLDGLPELPEADYCVAHVWMGDGNSMNESFDPIDKEVAAFMLHFSKKNILLSHLYDIGRPETHMWQERHGRIVAQRILEQSPDTKTLIPHRGEVILLGKERVCSDSD